MKVLLDTQWFAPRTGGIETFVATLAEQLSVRHGMDVTVLCRNPAPASVDAGRPYRVVRTPDERALREEVLRADRVLYSAARLRALPLHLRHRRPYGAIVHGLPEPHQDRGAARVRRTARELAARQLFRRGARVIAVPSAFMAARMPTAARVLPNSVRTDVFQDLSGARRGALYVGRITPGKGIEVLLAAWMHLSLSGRLEAVPEEHRRLTVVGHGAFTAEYHRAVLDSPAMSGVQVQAAVTDPVRLNRLMNEHAVGVVPSTGPEAFGIVGLELQAAGCAVLATHAGGLPEAVGDGALLVEPGDVEALADALERSLQDAALRADLAARGRANARRFTAEAMGDRYAELLADPTLW